MSKTTKMDCLRFIHERDWLKQAELNGAFGTKIKKTNIKLVRFVTLPSSSL